MSEPLSLNTWASDFSSQWFVLGSVWSLQEADPVPDTLVRQTCETSAAAMGNTVVFAGHIQSRADQD